VDGVRKQAEIVRSALDVDVPVRGVLCFVDGDWPLIGGAFTTRGVRVLWPKRLYSELQANGPIDAEGVAQVHRGLARVLRPA
jgi:hypothetical protein